MKYPFFFEPMICGKTQLAVKIILQRFSPRAFPPMCPFRSAAAAAASSWFIDGFECSIIALIWMSWIGLSQWKSAVIVVLPTLLCCCHTVFRSLTDTHTHAHTPTTPTSLAFFFSAACVVHSLPQWRWVHSPSGWMDWFFFSSPTWQIHIWLHWSVVAPSFFVQSFYFDIAECVWRIKTSLWLVGDTERFPFAWSGQSSIDPSVRHGLGLSGCISRARQPAPARASANQRRTWTLVLLARAHVSARNDCGDLKMENKCKADSSNMADRAAGFCDSYTFMLD